MPESLAIKILYDAQVFGVQRYGGISRYICELARRISRMDGTSAHILAPAHVNAYLPTLKAGVLIGWAARGDGPAGALEDFAARVTRKATEVLFRPDIVHETYYWGPVVNVRQPHLRVLTIHDMIHERFPSMFPAGDGTPAAKRRAAERADHVTCNSEATRADVLEMLGLPESKVSVVPHGAHLKLPERAAGSRHVSRPYVLYVGQRGGYKNFAGLLRAVGASPRLRELQLVCFGGGAFTSAELDLIRACGLNPLHVEHRSGGDAELASLYAGALCLVYPSMFEGFGAPPLEAMQCDCPVACSNTSSIPEVVGDAGVYFDPIEPDSIRAALERLVDSKTLRAELRTLGKIRVAKFTYDRCAIRTAELYKRLLGDTGRA